MTALDALGFGDLAVKLNSVGCRTCRREYTDVLRSALKEAGERLCEDCVERSDKNPLRVFDCKRCADVKDDLPAISEYLCEECSAHFDEVQVLLGDLGRSFDLDPRLVRGLDYYTKTTFEIIHGSLGAQNALCGGGRYDDLVEECGGPPTPAVGFSAGVERIIEVLPDGSSRQSGEAAGVDFYLICLDSDAASRALIAANVLRDFGTVEVDASLRVLKTQLRAAEKSGSKIAVIVDSKSPGLLIWKDMAERRQVEVPDEQLFETAKARVRGGKPV
jgi:histidyl-tRNA synthetase